MQICIDTNNVNEAVVDLKNTIDILIDDINYMKTRMNEVNQDFSDINFERASKDIEITFCALDSMFDNLNFAQKYLERIIGCIETYSKLKF